MTHAYFTTGLTGFILKSDGDDHSITIPWLLQLNLVSEILSKYHMALNKNMDIEFHFN